MPGQIALRTALWSSVLLAAASVGCSNKQVRIEMRSGAEGPVRTFETNRTTGEERTRLTEVYESGPLEATDGRSGVRFEGVFLDRDLPSEVGNRNGWSVLEGEFGSAYLYVEQFGEGRDDWKEFRSRMDAGELWLRLLAGFLKTRIESSDARSEFEAAFETELLPDLMSAFLRFNANGYVQQGQRIATRFREPSERGARTDDEWFQIQVFTPLVAFAVERDWIEASEGQMILLSGVDGWVSAGERQWSRDNLADPIVERTARRFVPDAVPGKIGPENEALVFFGLSFLWWVNTSSDAVPIMLESPAISESDKEKLRSGNRLIGLPGPFGIPIGGGDRPVDSEVVLETGVAPFVTNGTWDESLGTVTFRTKVYPIGQRRRMTPPVFHASWSVPDAEIQKGVFGDVVLRGQDLAEAVFWERTLSDEDRAAWREGVAASGSGDLATLQGFIERLEGDGKDDRPAPIGLRAAILSPHDE